MDKQQVNNAIGISPLYRKNYATVKTINNTSTFLLFLAVVLLSTRKLFVV
jgi:hypothetical protein